MRRPKKSKQAVKETDKDENVSVPTNKIKRRSGGCGCGGGRRRPNRSSEQ